MCSARRGMTLRDYCIQNDRKDLLEQWNKEKNTPLTPDSVSAHTKKKVWWKDPYGHEWQQAVDSRTDQNCGCPICANRVVLPGFNDLATTYPVLASEWDTGKNGTLTPQQVSAGSGIKAWWRCEKGHSWRARVASRVGGCSCPVCSNRIIVPGFNDLATTHPVLAAEWDQEKNGDLTPQRISYGYDKKVWWRCSLGHEWRASPKTRIRMAAGCPVCAGHAVQTGYNDLKTRYPLVAAEWNYEKNAPLTPDQVVAGSNRSVWWRCSLGHEWRADIVHRAVGTNRCPYCTGNKVLAGFNDLATLDSEVAAQWHPTLNGELLPTQITAGTRRRIWWICPGGPYMARSRIESHECQETHRLSGLCREHQQGKGTVLSETGGGSRVRITPVKEKPLNKPPACGDDHTTELEFFPFPKRSTGPWSV